MSNDNLLYRQIITNICAKHLNKVAYGILNKSHKKDILPYCKNFAFNIINYIGKYNKDIMYTILSKFIKHMEIYMFDVIKKRILYIKNTFQLNTPHGVSSHWKKRWLWSNNFDKIEEHFLKLWKIICFRKYDSTFDSKYFLKISDNSYEISIKGYNHNLYRITDGHSVNIYITVR